MQLDQGEVGAYYILYVTLYISYWISAAALGKTILIINRLLISFQHDQLQETHETQNAAQGGEWAQKVQSPEDSPQQGKNSYKLLLLFYTYYLITPLFKLLFLLPNFLGDLQTILVFCQDKHVDILLNIFFIPSGSTYTASPTTTAGTFSWFNFNSNFA